jgi:uncharacterized membrane-anchored protein
MLALRYADLWHDAREIGDRRTARHYAREISRQWRNLRDWQSRTRMLRGVWEVLGRR